VAASVFADAISRMTVSDARSILAGPNDAATQYFRRASETNLYELFLPIVKKTTDQTGVTASYKKLLQGAKSNRFLGALFDGGTPEGLDIDAYVTTKAMDGLFKMVADEEKQIRENPVARTTELLQRVFGGLTRR
jgi:hypothetical protein